MAHTGTFAVTGIPPPDGLVSKTKEIPYIPGMPVRLEINKLAKPTTQEGKDQWTLYVLALERFKAIPVEEKLSYFRVAGIHDYPQVSWDQGPPTKGKGDYCRHELINFPTWHRAYMLLFEQLVWKNMKEIITGWKLSNTETTRWLKAANSWRLPYWDWARKQLYAENFALAEVLTVKTVTIFPPAGLKEPIKNPENYPNPLYSFENPEKYGDGTPRPFGDMPEKKSLFNISNNPPGGLTTPANRKTLPWSLASATGRWGIDVSGDTYSGLAGINNFVAANKWLSEMEKKDHWYYYNPGTLSDAVNRLLSKNYNSSWAAFASTKWAEDNNIPTDQNSPGWLSLEFVHNNVHNAVGGGNWGTGFGRGHMSDVPVAAFDPVFWLHHCNIDRLFAFWQALYWKRWWTGAVAGDAAPTDPLVPFHNKNNGDPNGDMLTSNDVRDWSKLGYQYDDLVPNATAINTDGTLNEPKYITQLEAYIHKTYPGSAQVVSAIRGIGEIPVPEGLSREQGDTFKDYIINVQYDRYALEGRSYSIKFYLGGHNNVSETNFTERNYVGEVFTFSKPFRPTQVGATLSIGCRTCQKQFDEGVLSQGQILLTIPLLNHIYSERDDHPIKQYKQVAEYLKLHLRWKFFEHGDYELDASQFPRTVVSVLEGTAKPRYTDADLIAAAEAKAVAPLAVNKFAAQPTNDLKPVTAENVDPDAVALPPTFYDYVSVYKATDGKEGGLQAPTTAA